MIILMGFYVSKIQKYVRSTTNKEAKTIGHLYSCTVYTFLNNGLIK